MKYLIVGCIDLPLCLVSPLSGNKIAAAALSKYMVQLTVARDEERVRDKSDTVVFNGDHILSND